MYKYKVLSGSHSRKDLKGKRKTYFKGEVFEAFPVEVKHFMDKLEDLGQVDGKEDIPADDHNDPEKFASDAVDIHNFEIKIAGDGLFNVINKSTGDPINNEPLSVKDAEALLDDIENENKEPIKEKKTTKKKTTSKKRTRRK